MSKIYTSLLASIAYLLSMPVFANGTTLGEITQAAKRSGDKSREALVAIYGNVVNNPLATGGIEGGNTILASIFQVTNGALLVIGFIFASYAMFRKLSQTAHDGTVFDRDKTTIWGPIRLVLGLSALVPTANGWSLAQLLMLWGASVIGVGVANLGVDAAVAAHSNGQSMVVQPVMPSTVNLARNIFEINLCTEGINAGFIETAAISGINMRNEHLELYKTNSGGFVLRNGHFICGGADVDNHFEPQKRSTNWWPINNTIDTSEIRLAHSKALIMMQNNLHIAAHNFVTALVFSMPLPDAEIAIQSVAQEYENIVNKAVGKKQGNIAQLANQLSTSIKEGGWWMLGAWYQTFAQANTKLSTAVAAKASVYGMSSENVPMRTTYKSVMAAYRTQQALSTYTPTLGTVKSGDYSKGVTGSEPEKIIGSFFSAPGQSIINYLIDWNFNGKGLGQVNPLIKMKNLGDYTMAAVEAGLGVYVAAKIAAKKSKIIGQGVAKLSTKVSDSLIGSMLLGALEAMSPFVIMAVIALFLLGGTLSTYLPMVPFIIWFGGIINWLVVVGEAIVAAPLWAITHLGGEGDGMGHRTAHGYIFMLNVMVRPILMVVGFFLGGAAIIAGGTLLNQLFGIAIANAQFNSMTGLFSIIFYLAIYVSMCLNLVHSCFNLIFIVPDQVINWVGGHAAATPGRDDNDRLRNALNVFTNKMEHITPGRGNREKQNQGNEKPGDGIKQ